MDLGLYEYMSKMKKKMTQKWILEQKYPNSKSCFLLGNLENHEVLSKFSEYNHVVWFIENDNLPKESNLYKNLYPMILETIDEVKLDEIIQTLLSEDFDHIPAIYCSESITKSSPAAFNLIIQKIQVFSEQKIRSNNAVKSFGFLSQKNIVQNITSFAKNQLPEESGNSLKEIPIAIIGGGPSIDETLYLIEKYQKEFIIFCTDTVCLNLNKIGINPEFVISVDPLKNPQDYIGTSQKLSSLFLSLKSPPEWTELEVEGIHFINGKNLADQWLSENGFLSNTPKISGNVGITAVELAIFWGCNPIMLFGMDHAVSKSGKKWNKEYARFERDNSNTETDPSLKSVKGNYSSTVKTHVLNEWEQLDKIISNLPNNQEIWNINDRGAKFTDAKLIHPKEFVFSSPTILDKESLHFKSKSHIEKSKRILRLSLLMKDILNRNEDDINLLINKRSVDKDTQLLIANLLKDQDIFKIWGNFTLKISPLIIKWDDLPLTEREEILKETKSMLLDLRSMHLSLDELN